MHEVNNVIHISSLIAIEVLTKQIVEEFRVNARRNNVACSEWLMTKDLHLVHLRLADSVYVFMPIVGELCLQKWTDRALLTDTISLPGDFQSAKVVPCSRVARNRSQRLRFQKFETLDAL